MVPVTFLVNHRLHEAYISRSKDEISDGKARKDTIYPDVATTTMKKDKN